MTTQVSSKKIDNQTSPPIAGSHILEATSAKLKWALEQDQPTQYTFKGSGGNFYHILEIAVVFEDLAAVSKLKQLGVPFAVNDYALKFGNILHYYLNHLPEDDFKPHIELLNLIIDNIPDINLKDNVYYATPLEFALCTMSDFENVHWDVIETLLKRGAGISKNPVTHQTPLELLCDSMRCKDFEEGNGLLDRLVTYLKLEKKHHWDSTSGLSLDLFKLQTQHFWGPSSGEAIRMATLAYGGSRAALEKNNQRIDDLLLRCDEVDELAKLKELLATARKNNSDSQQTCLCDLIERMVKYHDYFEALVREGEFVECFDPVLLPLFGTAIKGTDNELAHTALRVFKSWGLPVEKTA